MDIVVITLCKIYIHVQNPYPLTFSPPLPLSLSQTIPPSVLKPKLKALSTNNIPPSETLRILPFLLESLFDVRGSERHVGVRELVEDAVKGLILSCLPEEGEKGEEKEKEKEGEEGEERLEALLLGYYLDGVFFSGLREVCGVVFNNKDSNNDNDNNYNNDDDDDDDNNNNTNDNNNNRNDNDDSIKMAIIKWTYINNFPSH